ncbi:NACHT domain-containing protein [Dactylosporangium sp. NPDC050688]|uniref:NACHT domain-containing protein n=1 Tax=Dactylosporangium sp. NPDC050688 TaxID=3157217 RepID=UPI0033D98B23
MTSTGDDGAGEGVPSPQQARTSVAQGHGSVAVSGDNTGSISTNIVQNVRQFLVFGRRTRTSVDQAAEHLAVLVERQWSKEALRLKLGADDRLEIRWGPAPARVCASATESRKWMAKHAPSTVKRRGEQWATSDAALAGVDLDLVDAWMNSTPSRRLIVLGDAGSGKSHLALRALIALITRRADFDAVVPVLIPVASWDSGSVAAWLENWLVRNYRFLGDPAPGRDGDSYAAALLRLNKIAIILDGFDELPASSRQDFVRQLGLELPGHPQWAILLTSRPAEYSAVAFSTDSPGLGGAMGVRLLPQRGNEVIDYLAGRSLRAGRWKDVADSIRQGHIIAAVLETPLMVMLADAVYNSDPDRSPPPEELRAFADPKEVEQHLLDSYVPAQFGDERRWKLADVKRWLNFLASTLNSRANPTDLTWWNLRPAANGDRRHTRWIQLTVFVAIVVWTALSATTFTGWVYQNLQHGLFTGARIATAAAIGYLTTLLLTKNLQASLLAALGAYIAGTVTASYDLAVCAAIAGGFAWRPLSVRRSPWWHYLVFGSVVGTAGALVQSTDPPFDSTPDKATDPPWTQGFGSGFIDGWVNRGDEVVNGWLLSAIMSGVLLWAAIRSAPQSEQYGPVRAHRWGPLGHAVGFGLLVGAVDSWANAAGPGVTDGWLTGPADGFAIGVVVWSLAGLLSRGAHTASPQVPRQRARRSGPAARRQEVRHAWRAALIAGLVALGLNGMGYSARTDMTQPWGQSAAAAFGVALVVWFVLHPDRLAPHRRRRGGRFGIWVAACTIAGATGYLDAVSAGGARGIITGLSIGLTFLYARYTLSLRVTTPATAARSVFRSPLDAGMLVVMLVGIVAGFAYGLMFGMAFGLAVQVSRDVSQRHFPSRGPNVSWLGVVGGLILGAVAAVAAGFSGIAPGWLVPFGLATGAAAAVAFGTHGRVLPENVVMTPLDLLRADRRTFLTALLIVAVAPGLAASMYISARGGTTQACAVAAVQITFTYGLTAGLLVASAQSRYGAYTLWRLIYWVRDRLPLRLMTFLVAAHDRGILRQNGVTYQFRHQFLQDRLEKVQDDGPAETTER